MSTVRTASPSHRWLLERRSGAFDRVDPFRGEIRRWSSAVRRAALVQRRTTTLTLGCLLVHSRALPSLGGVPIGSDTMVPLDRRSGGHVRPLPQLRTKRASPVGEVGSPDCAPPSAVEAGSPTSAPPSAGRGDGVERGVCVTSGGAFEFRSSAPLLGGRPKCAPPHAPPRQRRATPRPGPVSAHRR